MHRASREFQSASRPVLTGRQAGIALLALLALLGLLVGMFVFGLGGNMAQRNAENQRSADALAQAKEALISYAARYPDDVAKSDQPFGQLPCPDVDGGSAEGVAELNCGLKDRTAIGRLPWKTLGLPPLRDSAAECLWYAVSGTFKYNPKSDLMNWDTQGQIEAVAADGTTLVAGATPMTRAAAIVFAPGPILAGQDRSPAGSPAPTVCGGNYTASNYLDTDAGSGISNSVVSSTPFGLTRFITASDSDRTAPTNDLFNDRFLVITPEEIFARRAQLRSDFLKPLLDPATGVLRRAADCIAEYGKRNTIPTNSKALPWAAPLAISDTTSPFTFFGDATNYRDQSDLLSGRLPYRVPNSDATTTNSMVTTNSGTLLQSSVCAGVGWDTKTDNYWEAWKDHFFYAIADAHKPTSPSALVTQLVPCSDPSAKCLLVDGAGPFAAVLLFAMDRQAGQNRVTNLDYSSTDKGNPANYLAGVNLAAILENNKANAAWGVFTKTGVNDALVCILPDLSVDPTCSNVSACTLDANILLSYRDGMTNKNNCKVGKKARPECTSAVDRLTTNNCSCKKPAGDYIKKPCIDNLGGGKCVNAITALDAC